MSVMGGRPRRKRACRDGHTSTGMPVSGTPRDPSTARYFFHLCKGEQVLQDELGVELSAVDDLRDIFVRTASEMQREEELNLSEFDGWEVRVADAAGRVVMEFRLSDLKGGAADL